jgi:hypothetical protein
LDTRRGTNSRCEVSHIESQKGEVPIHWPTHLPSYILIPWLVVSFQGINPYGFIGIGYIFMNFIITKVFTSSLAWFWNQSIFNSFSSTYQFLWKSPLTIAKLKALCIYHNHRNVGNFHTISSPQDKTKYQRTTPLHYMYRIFYFNWYVKFKIDHYKSFHFSCLLLVQIQCALQCKASYICTNPTLAHLH